jgi:glycosyltransferase involved in cell wall biosynthesis
MTPTLSVLMCAYNGERYIAASIESILAQTVRPLEVIVVDDGSSDSTRAIAAAYEPRVRVLSSENQGVAAAANWGFSEAQGDYVGLCAQDDLWVPQKAEWQLETLSRHPHVDVSVGHMVYFGDRRGDYWRPHAGGLLDGPRLFKEQFDTNSLAAPTAMIRRELHQRLGGFREDLLAEDYEFWFRALKAGAVFHYDARTLVDYRSHGQSLSRRTLSLVEMGLAVRLQYAGQIEDESWRSMVLSREWRRVGFYRRSFGDYRGAGRAYAAAHRMRPSPGTFAAACACAVRATIPSRPKAS